MVLIVLLCFNMLMPTRSRSGCTPSSSSPPLYPSSPPGALRRTFCCHVNIFSLPCSSSFASRPPPVVVPSGRPFCATLLTFIYLMIVLTTAFVPSHCGASTMFCSIANCYHIVSYGSSNAFLSILFATPDAA